jgi:hypothetical protein
MMLTLTTKTESARDAEDVRPSAKLISVKTGSASTQASTRGTTR